MNVSEIPRPERARQAPPVDVPVLTWWASIYPHAFVAPNPFYRLPLPGAFGEGAWSFAPVDHPDGIDDPDEVHEAFEARAKASAHTLSWPEARARAAPEAPPELSDRAAWLLAIQGHAPARGPELLALQHRLEAWMQAERWFLPTDGRLPPAGEPAIGRFLEALGAHEVLAISEFDEVSTSIPVSALRPGAPALRLTRRLPDGREQGRPVDRLHLPDPGVLLAWGFDCAEALIGMTDAALSRARPDAFFEARPLGPDAFCDVFNPPDFLRPAR
ncbi:hypothetical protein [Albimonas pacifica]|uniref:Uncharacterized protein n=1 Tax=Albimonas pacifica TaxID=1114924 RepID=A0A1I3LX49_9RHOB|nr:hypothetical protein [Albimonas pacifica]SFI89292.1 hypothetical protein SAMN05216258_110214 [Albimonas pacifica]